MIWRALLAVLILPGIFAGLLPAWVLSLDPNRGTGSPWGLIALGLGAVLFIWCVRDFLVSGKGTLAPWDPPRHLVVVGLYRFVRNPMYVAILIFLLGWSVVAGSWWLGGYAALLAIAFHLRIVLYEEPTLRRQFGDEWNEYVGRVGRWCPRPGHSP